MLQLPEDMKHLINYDEKIIWVLRASELIAITDQRIIMRKSGGLGLKKSFVDYPYSNMVNIRLDKGMRKASVEILMRSGVQSVRVTNLSKNDAYQFHRIVRENIIRASGPHSAQSYPIIIQSPEHPTQNVKDEDQECSKCKRKISVGFSLCPYCGYALKIECPECGKLVDRKFKLCPYCGEDISYLENVDMGLEV